MQRPIVIRQTTQNFQERLADLLFPTLRLGNGVDLINRFLSFLQLPLCNPVHPAKKWVANGFLRKKEAGNQKRYTQ